MIRSRVPGCLLVLGLAALGCSKDSKGGGTPPGVGGSPAGEGGAGGTAPPPRVDAATASGGASGASGAGGTGGTAPPVDAARGGADARDVAVDTAADSAPVAGPLPWPEANAIVAAVMAAMPVFPDRNCTITDAAYGGRADGSSDNTDAFKKAMTACSQAGGGHVVVPAGNYLSGAIELLDNVDLHLERGATILFSGDASKFPIVLTRYEGIELMNRSPMIYAYQKKNIAVTGPGVLDASRTSSWNTGAGRARLETWANDNVPVAQRVGNQSRSSFVEPYASTNVLIQGITLRGAQFWQIHPTLSKFVLVDGVTTTDSGNSNNDGFDPESCDHVVLTNSVIKAGDDAMAIKSGRDADGRRINKPMSNLVIMHSSFASRWGLLTLGSELTGGIQNVYGYDLKTIAGDTVKYVLELKGNSQRGGFITDVHLDKISATRGVGSAVMWADMQYMGQTGPYSPKYDKFTLSHVVIDGAPIVLDLTGMSAANPLGSVALDHSTFTNIGNANNSIQFVRSVTWDQVTINGQPAR